MGKSHQLFYVFEPFTEKDKVLNSSKNLNPFIAEIIWIWYNVREVMSSAKMQDAKRQLAGNFGILHFDRAKPVNEENDGFPNVHCGLASAGGTA